MPNTTVLSEQVTALQELDVKLRHWQRVSTNTNARIKLFRIRNRILKSAEDLELLISDLENPVININDFKLTKEEL